MPQIIDMHVHFGAPKDEQSGCFWSEKFERTPAYWFMKISSGSLFKKMTFERILKQLLSVPLLNMIHLQKNGRMQKPMVK